MPGVAAGPLLRQIREMAFSRMGRRSELRGVAKPSPRSAAAARAVSRNGTCLRSRR